MKLVQCNVEGMRHLETVEELLKKEDPDVVCLQEANENHRHILESLGHQVSFIPEMIENRDNEMLPEGVMFGSKTPYTPECVYYFKPSDELQLADMDKKRVTYRQGYICADVTIDNATYTIVTTHFTWTPQGEIPCQDQLEDMDTLLSLLKSKPAHILVGDMNFPRHHSPLYARLLERYTDEIPTEYKISLDKTFHRLGNDPEKADLFTDFMVDYVFTQPPYTAHNVRLRFGVSDHAAVIAEIEKLSKISP